MLSGLTGHGPFRIYFASQMWKQIKWPTNKHTKAGRNYVPYFSLASFVSESCRENGWEMGAASLIRHIFVILYVCFGSCPFSRQNTKSPVFYCLIFFFIISHYVCSSHHSFFIYIYSEQSRIANMSFGRLIQSPWGNWTTVYNIQAQT